MNYFREILTTDQRVEELASFKGKVVGTFCNFVPEELVYALGALPVRLCSGDDAAVKAGEEIFPRDTCSLVKSCAGMAVMEQPLFKRLDLLVVPTPCDAKKKLGGVLESFKKVHILQLPPSKSDASAQQYWMSQVWDLIAALESLTGQRLTRDKLQDAIRLLNRRQEVFRRLFRLRKLSPSVITGEEALLVTGASFLDDVERWIENAERMCDEREERFNQQQFVCSAHAPRLLLTGAPLIYPNFKLIRLIEAAGAVVAIDEMCSGTERLYHPTVARDWSVKPMVRAVAEKCLLPSTCPCFIEHTDGLNRVRELYEEFQVDGVVYHSLRVCPLFDVDSLLIQRDLKQRSLPCLTLATDYSREDTQQLRNRIEAFIEMIGSQSRRNERNALETTTTRH